MRCIFCLEEREPSEEHVFPKAIGGTLIIRRVCKPCNDMLGAKVDVLLTDHPVVLIKRAELGMGDRSGKPIDLRQMVREGRLATDPSQIIDLVPDEETGRLEPRMRYRSIPIRNEDGSETKQISLDASQIGELEKIAQRHRKREGQAPFSKEEIQALLTDARQNTQTIEPGVTVNYALQVDTWEYRRAIYKIIYELAWNWLGDAYLDDPIAGTLREFIVSGEERPSAGRIAMGLLPELSWWSGEDKAHLAMGMSSSDDKFFIGVRVFNDLVSGSIRVTDTAAKYPVIGGRFLLIGLNGAPSRDCTVQQEIEQMNMNPPDLDG